MNRRSHASSLLLSFLQKSSHTYTRQAFTPRERRPYIALHTHQCMMKSAQLEQSGLRPGEGVTLTSAEVESTSSLVGRRAVFRTNGHLMKTAAEGRFGFAEPPIPWNSIAGMAERCERNQVEAGGGTKMATCPQAQNAAPPCVHHCRSMLLPSITVICRDQASWKRG